MGGLGLARRVVHGRLVHVKPAPAARAFPTAEGFLDARPVAELLAYIDDRGLSGTLTLTSPTGVEDASVTFRDGKVVRARTRVPSPLGTALYELGLVEPDALDRALRELAAGKGALLGEILLAQKALTAEVLAIGLAEHYTRKLVSLFALPVATRFAFYEHTDLLASFGRADVSVSVGRAVVRGLRDTFDAQAGRANDALDRVGERPLVLAGYVEGAPTFGLVERLADLEMSEEEEGVAKELSCPAVLPPRRATREGLLRTRVVYTLLLLRRARIATVSPENEALRHASMKFRAPSPLRPPSVAFPVSGVREKVEPPPAAVRDVRREADDPGKRVAPRETERGPRADVAADPTLARLKARGLLRRGELRAALALVVELRSLTPGKDAELETMYGYCVGMTREDLQSREEARSALRRGCELSPRSGEALYRMALFERKEGQLASALRTLREAVDVDPHHVDAARELRLFGMRVASGMDPARAMSPPHGIPAVKDPRKE